MQNFTPIGATVAYIIFVIRQSTVRNEWRVKNEKHLRAKIKNVNVLVGWQGRLSSEAAEAAGGRGRGGDGSSDGAETQATARRRGTDRASGDHTARARPVAQQTAHWRQVSVCTIITRQWVQVVIVPQRIIWSWYNGRWRLRCWYSKEGLGRSRSPPRPLRNWGKLACPKFTPNCLFYLFRLSVWFCVHEIKLMVMMTMMMKGSAGLDLYTNSLSRHAMSQFSPNFLCLRQAILQLSVRLFVRYQTVDAMF